MSRPNGTGDAQRCGTCTHFHQLPADPHNLGAPRQGLCLEGPPQPALVVGPQGQAGTVWAFPMLPSVHMACHRHEVVVAKVEGG